MNKPILLIVDDDPQVLAAVRRDLRSRYRESYTVMSAASGDDALALSSIFVRFSRHLAKRQKHLDDVVVRIGLYGGRPSRGGRGNQFGHRLQRLRQTRRCRVNGGTRTGLHFRHASFESCAARHRRRAHTPTASVSVKQNGFLQRSRHYAVADRFWRPSPAAAGRFELNGDVSRTDVFPNSTPNHGIARRNGPRYAISRRVRCATHRKRLKQLHLKGFRPPADACWFVKPPLRFGAQVRSERRSSPRCRSGRR